MRRIGLLGAECTGKSTVAAAIAAEFGAVHVPEALRSFTETRGRVPEQQEQAGILSEQRASVLMAELDHSGAVVICDPLPLMTAVYSVAYFDDASLIDEGIRDARDYDLIYWCRPDLMWEADGIQRDGEERRQQVDDLIAQAVRDFHLPVTELRGDLDARVRAAIDGLHGRVTP